MTVFLGQPGSTAPAAGCDCRRCPWYSGDDAEPGVTIAPLCSGCNSDCSYCSYCGCARADLPGPKRQSACGACPIRCGSRVDIRAWMSDVGGTLEFEDIALTGALPDGLPSFIPQIDGSSQTHLDAALHWPAYAVGLRRVFSLASHEIFPRWRLGGTATEVLGLPSSTLTVLSGYGEDPLVELFWTVRHRERLVERLVSLGFDLVLAPNFSDGGCQMFRAALARHARREGTIFWVRPLVAAGTDPGTGMPAFDLQINRRRALDVAEAHAENGRLELMLTTGQAAVIQPASGPPLGVLADFDSWLATLSALAVARLDQLEDDTEMV